MKRTLSGSNCQSSGSVSSSITFLVSLLSAPLNLNRVPVRVWARQKNRRFPAKIDGRINDIHEVERSFFQVSSPAQKVTRHLIKSVCDLNQCKQANELPCPAQETGERTSAA